MLICMRGKNRASLVGGRVRGGAIRAPCLLFPFSPLLLLPLSLATSTQITLRELHRISVILTKCICGAWTVSLYHLGVSKECRDTAPPRPPRPPDSESAF